MADSSRFRQFIIIILLANFINISANILLMKFIANTLRKIFRQILCIWIREREQSDLSHTCERRVKFESISSSGEFSVFHDCCATFFSNLRFSLSEQISRGPNTSSSRRFALLLRNCWHFISHRDSMTGSIDFHNSLRSLSIHRLARVTISVTDRVLTNYDGLINDLTTRVIRISRVYPMTALLWQALRKLFRRAKTKWRARLK